MDSGDERRGAESQGDRVGGNDRFRQSGKRGWKWFRGWNRQWLRTWLGRRFYDWREEGCHLFEGGAGLRQRSWRRRSGTFEVQRKERVNLVDQKGGQLPLEAKLLGVEIVVVEVVISLVLGWTGKVKEGQNGLGKET